MIDRGNDTIRDWQFHSLFLFFTKYKSIWFHSIRLDVAASMFSLSFFTTLLLLPLAYRRLLEQPAIPYYYYTMMNGYVGIVLCRHRSFDVVHTRAVLLPLLMCLVARRRREGGMRFKSFHYRSFAACLPARSPHRKRHLASFFVLYFMASAAALLNRFIFYSHLLLLTINVWHYYHNRFILHSSHRHLLVSILFIRLYCSMLCVIVDATASNVFYIISFDRLIVYSKSHRFKMTTAVSCWLWVFFLHLVDVLCKTANSDHFHFVIVFSRLCLIFYFSIIFLLNRRYIFDFNGIF